MSLTSKFRNKGLGVLLKAPTDKLDTFHTVFVLYSFHRPNGNKRKQQTIFRELTCRDMDFEEFVGMCASNCDLLGVKLVNRSVDS